MLNNSFAKIDINKVKLIIWDLDETFWKGTLSEETVEFVDRNVEIIKVSTDCGVINSICSKNEFSSVEKTLSEIDLWDYFVHPSINWETKGHRIKALIEALQLRDDNVLFIDDNESNLEEVKFYNPNIMALNAMYIDELHRVILGLERKDLAHKRLGQYKVLESKINKKTEYKSNYEFLMSCNICVDVHYDCMQEVERIHELIMRTNQLNYTKRRISKEELLNLIGSCEYECAYITASDSFGDYGIVGFYCLKDNELQHFLFSCRCMGMGIEQYVYSRLKFPKLQVVGSVSVPLNNTEHPDYINRADTQGSKKMLRSKLSPDVKMLLKGPCDMGAVFSFIEESKGITCELTYVSPDTGVSIEQHNHSQCILQALSISKERVNEIASELPFGDIHMYDQSIFTQKYDIIFYSLLSDCGLGVYRRKRTGEYVCFSQYNNPLTDPDKWAGYLNGTTPSSNCKFDEQDLRRISENYEFEGRLSPEKIIDNVKRICDKLDRSTVLVLMLGSEIPYEKNTNPNYADRHIFHKKVNDLAKRLARENSQIRLIEYTDCIKSQADFYDNINHYMRPVYYRIAEKMLLVAKESMGFELKRSGKMKLYFLTIKQYIKKLIRR